MKINFNNFYLFSVPVDFDIAWLKILFSNHLIVELECEGKKAIGEGVLYNTSPIKTLSLLDNEFKAFFQKKHSSFGKARSSFLNAFSSHPGIVCAFDLALWNLQGKSEDKPIYQLLGNKKNPSVLVTEQIFIPKDERDLTAQVKEILSHGTRSIKLKAGRDLKKDLARIKMIKKISKDKINIQLDLNQGLNFNQAVWLGRIIEKLGISAWEEPISFDSFKQLRNLKEKVKIPIILDESIKNIEDLKKAVKNKAIDILNIKISRLAGLTGSLQLIRLCEEHKIKIDIGCSEELGIATNAQLHLGAIVQNLKTMEVLGSRRLGFDLIKEKHKIKNGRLELNLSKPGLGKEFKVEKLKKAGEELNFSVITGFNKKYYFPFYFNYFKTRIKNKFFNGLLLLKKQTNKICLRS